MVQQLDDLTTNNFPGINYSSESKKQKREHLNLKFEIEFSRRELGIAKSRPEKYGTSIL